MSGKRLSLRALREMGIAEDQIACTCSTAGQQVFIDADCPVHATHPEPTPESVERQPVGAAGAILSMKVEERTEEDIAFNAGLQSAATWIASSPTDHPRTYSLVGSPDLFLVTDDESHINIGYASKIGGPLTRLALAATAPSGLDVETLRKALDGFLTERGEYRGISPERLAAEYSWVAARLRESADQERTEG